jgi:hypothetical protein
VTDARDHQTSNAAPKHRENREVRYWWSTIGAGNRKMRGPRLMLAATGITHNWGKQGYGGGPNFGHVAMGYEADDIYAKC